MQFTLHMIEDDVMRKGVLLRWPLISQQGICRLYNPLTTPIHNQLNDIYR